MDNYFRDKIVNSISNYNYIINNKTKIGLVATNKKAQNHKLSLLSSINVSLITHNYLICLCDFIFSFVFLPLLEHEKKTYS